VSVTGGGRSETALIAGGLAVIAAIVYWPFLQHGGFVLDDWAIQSYYREGYGSAVARIHDVLGTRPLMWVLQPLPYAVLGTGDPTPHLLMALGLSVATAGVAYVFLGSAGLSHAHAATVSVLFLLFPWDSSVRLWPIAALAQLSVLLILTGGVLALSGLGRHGATARRRHAAAVACFVLAVLVYEAATPVVFASGLLYASRASWRAARPRWIADVLGVGLALAWAQLNWTRTSPSRAEQISFVPHFAHDALLLLSRAAIPVRLEGAPPAAVLILVLVLVLVAASVLTLRRIEADDPDRGVLRRWLFAAGAAAIALPLSWVLLLASVAFTPISEGIDNRALLVWSLAMLAVTLAVRLARTRRVRVGAPITALVALLLVGGYALRARDDAEGWSTAGQERRQVLARIERLPPLPRGSTVYAFGQRALAAPRVPVFFKAWDLAHAVRIVRGDRTLRAYPVFDGARLRCARDGIRTFLPGPGGRLDGPDHPGIQASGYEGPDPGSPYGHAVYVDIKSGAIQMIRDRAACRSAADAFRPGPGGP
jgi:hypothetical protein